MTKINNRLQQQTIVKETCGICMYYKDKHGFHEEEVTNVDIETYKIRHNVVTKYSSISTSGRVEIVTDMINYYNKTLKPYDHKRTLISTFVIHNSKTYNKISNVKD